MGYNSANSSNQNWNSYPINLSLKIPSDQIKEYITYFLSSLTEINDLVQFLKLWINNKEVLHKGVYLVVSPIFGGIIFPTIPNAVLI